MGRRSTYQRLAGLGSLVGLGIGVAFIVRDYSLKLISFPEDHESPVASIKVALKQPSANKLTYFDVLYSPPEQFSVEAPEHDDSLKWQHLAAQPSRNTLTEALTRVLGEETPGAVKVTATHIPPNTGSAYAVQVSSFTEHSAAETNATHWRSKGYDTRVVQGELEKQQIVYRVRIHGFTSAEEAEAAKDKFEQSENSKALVIAQN